MNIFTSFFNKKAQAIPKEQVLHDLMMRESELAKGIFGEIGRGGRREFFCLDSRTWVWYEQWVDDAGESHTVTTRYMIRSKEIVKSQNGGAYHRLTLSEAKNFHKATKAYLNLIKKSLYNKSVTA